MGATLNEPLFTEEELNQLLAEMEHIVSVNFSDEIIWWAITTLNEKWESDYGKAKRWIKRHGSWKCHCPECLKDNGFLGYKYSGQYANYCPNCGIMLLPPEKQ